MTYRGADGGPPTLVHTHDSVLDPSLEITPILVASDCDVWNHNDLDVAVDAVSVMSADPPACD